MTSFFRRIRIPGLLLVGAALALAFTPLSADAATDGKYTVPVGDEYKTRAILSVGDTVPETSNPGQQYQMVGIPDGIGAHAIDGDDDDEDGGVALFLNHEPPNLTTSEPNLGQPLNRGAIVSRYILDEDGEVISGERAYDTVYNENALVGPAPEVGNVTPGFGRFCSSSLAGPEYGFDRNIYFTNEEGDPAETFDGTGGQSVAIFDNKLHILPKLGHFKKENTLAMLDTGSKTVIVSLEDGPSGPDSQLYLNVGTKDFGAPSGSLARNGWITGACTSSPEMTRPRTPSSASRAARPPAGGYK